MQDRWRNNRTGEQDSPFNLGDYELIDELGRGGMGRVLLARRVGKAGFQRLFAIKVLHEDMIDDPEALLMFLDEANITSKIHHPNVVPIVHSGTYEEGHYLVLDYVEGCSFSDLLKRNPDDRPTRLLIPILLDALRGLHAAHELVEPDGTPLNLVHRDFSPQNLLIGVDGTCRVTDFGIAKVSVRFINTEVGRNKGKLSFMSPEQLSAAKDIDRRADIWAAGVVLYTAICGTHPFHGPSEGATVTNILRAPLATPSSVGFHPPTCLDPIVLKSLQRKRSRRYSTAVEMADDLHNVAVKNDLLASPSEVASWVRKTFEKELQERKKKLLAIEQGTESYERPLLPLRRSLSGRQKTRTESQTKPQTPKNIDEFAPTGLEQPIEQSELAEDPPFLPTQDVELVSKERKNLPKIILIIGAMVVLALVSFLALSFNWQPETPLLPAEAVTPERQSNPETNELTPPETTEQTQQVDQELLSTDEPTGPEPVQIKLRGLPEGAIVKLDGNPIENIDKIFVIKDTSHKISIKARGYLTWKQTIRPEADLVLKVDLKRRPRRPRPRKNTGIVRNPGF